ncbi:hypothetical protein ACI65C_013529 [Semiaphis heraclei]
MSKSFNIFESNPYMFAVPYTIEGTYKRTDCLRDTATKSGAISPELLRSTKLRKHVATMTQLLSVDSGRFDELKGKSIEELDNFMPPINSDTDTDAELDQVRKKFQKLYQQKKGKQKDKIQSTSSNRKNYKVWTSKEI